MAYKVSGNLSRQATVVVMDSSGVVQKSEVFPQGAWEIDTLTCSSGIVFGIDNIDNYRAYGNVNFIEYNHRPSVPWTDSLSSELNKDYWELSSSDAAFTLNNKLRFIVDSSNLNRKATSKFYIQGDFDVEVSYDAVSTSNSNSWSINLAAVFDCEIHEGSGQLHIETARIYAGGHYYRLYGFNPTNFSYTSSTSHFSGKLRLTRSGSVISGYYWSGSAWVFMNNVDFGSSHSGWPVYFALSVRTADNKPKLIADVYNFKVNSGTIQYRFEDNCVNYPNYASPSEEIYTAFGPYPKPYIYNNKLRFDVDYSKKLVWESNTVVALAVRKQLVGDFDVSVDLDLIVGPTQDNWQYKLQLQNSNSSYVVTVGRWYASSVGHVYNVEVVLNGNYTGYPTSSVTDIASSLRVKRLGTTVYVYYKQKQSLTWTLHRTVTGFTNNNLSIALIGINAGAQAYGASIADFSNLTINNSSNINTFFLTNPSPNFTTTVFEPYTTLLLHFDENPIRDSSRNNYSITVNGGMGRDSSQSKFGGYSAYFDGINDDILIADSEDWYFGTANFTIDFWWRPTSLSINQGFIGQTENGNNFWGLMWDRNQQKIKFVVKDGGSLVLNVAQSSEGGWEVNTWYHVAIVRNGSQFKIYRNGAAIVSEDISNINIKNFIASLNIGYHAEAGYLQGYIDELRISKGTARWVVDFTPPTSAYAA